MTDDEYTNQSFRLEVTDGHELYVHDWGKGNGTPILYLHGGPGSCVKDSNKQLFDGQKQRVIFFDQRGCGQSIPLGSLDHNTTDDLVGDMARILDELKLESVIVTGMSWGSTLALCFAIKHPGRVQAMVLGGIWTCRQKETDWVEGGGLRTFFPDAWDTYVQTVPETERANPTAWHFKQLGGPSLESIKAAAYAYRNLEGAAIKLDDRFLPEPYAGFDPASALIELTFVANKCYLPENYIFDNASTLTMPIRLVHARYDMVCPPVTAYELSKVLPNASLDWVIGGHAAEHENWQVMRIHLLQLAAEHSSSE